jgi:hypothetical protein
MSNLPSPGVDIVWRGKLPNSETIKWAFWLWNGGFSDDNGVVFAGQTKLINSLRRSDPKPQPEADIGPCLIDNFYQFLHHLTTDDRDHHLHVIF